MRRNQLRAHTLYAAQAAERSTRIVPALVLDTDLWDRIPGPPVSLTPAPDDGRSPNQVYDPDTGARRGILVAIPRPGTSVSDQLLQDLTWADGYTAAIGQFGEADGIKRLNSALAEKSLILDVIRDARITSTWADHTADGGLSCPGCGRKPILLDSASRIRGHFTPQGARCDRSRTPLRKEER